MAKLTVLFKEKVIYSKLFSNGVVHIGRDAANDITIDSLAVAPVHAALHIEGKECQIKQLNDSFPISINGEKVKLYVLRDNDEITIGKHTIVYNVSSSFIESDKVGNKLMDTHKDVSLINTALEKDVQMIATLQVTNGPNIGKILTIKNTMTRLGNAGTGVAVIAKRKEGYFVSVLENTGTITVNGEPLADKTIKLECNDILVINNASLQFFLEITRH